MPTTTVTPGQPALHVEIGSAVAVDTLVRYSGSLEDQHGYYRVEAVLDNPNGADRYYLVEGTGLCPEGQTLYNVGRSSLTVVA